MPINNNENRVMGTPEAEGQTSEAVKIVKNNRKGIKMLLVALSAITAISIAAPTNASASLKNLLQDKSPPHAAKTGGDKGSKAPDKTAEQIKQLQDHIWGTGKVPPLPIPPVDGFLGGKCKNKDPKCGTGLNCSATTGKCEGSQGSILSSCRTPKKAEKDGEQDVTACDGTLVCKEGQCTVDTRATKSVEERLDLTCGTTGACGKDANLMTTATVKDLLETETKKAQEKANNDKWYALVTAFLGLLGGGITALFRGRKTRKDVEVLMAEVAELRRGAADDDDE